MDWEDMISIKRERALKRKEEERKQAEADEDSDDDGPPIVGGKRKRSRAGKKNAKPPEEVTSKKQVGRFRVVVPGVKKYKAMDPRFNDSMGGPAFSEAHFQKNYAFLNEIKDEETKELKKTMRKVKSKTKIEAMKQELKQKKLNTTEDKRQSTMLNIKQEVKRTRQKQRGEGKNPFFLKKSEEKMLGLGARFLELKKTGRLSKFMEKKRKKKDNKDHVWMPHERRLE